MTKSTALTTTTQQPPTGALSFLGDVIMEPIELPGWCRD